MLLINLQKYSRTLALTTTDFEKPMEIQVETLHIKLYSPRIPKC